MPNFVRFETTAGKRQDGYKIEQGYDIANFTEEEAISFADLMREEFLKHWKQRKMNNNGKDS
jgi:hypothetical protein